MGTFRPGRLGRVLVAVVADSVSLQVVKIESNRHDALLGLAGMSVDGQDLKNRRSATDICEREGRIKLGRPSEDFQYRNIVRTFQLHSLHFEPVHGTTK